MGEWFKSVYDVGSAAGQIERRRYGVIEVNAGQFTAIHFRPWPKIISTIEASWLGGWQHGRRRRDQCLLYYNQPIGHDSYLALKYVVSSFGTSYRTFRQTLAVLDEVARIKQTDAIVADVTNQRISDRLLSRQGWEPHLPDSNRRHFIKRFYGRYSAESVTSASGEIPSHG
jgi:hypothetical protein